MHTTPELTESYYSRLGSEIFELIADGCRKPFFMQKNLITRQCQGLRIIANAAVTADRKVNLQAWDGETVGRLVGFLYLRTYEARKPELLSSTDDSSEGSEGSGSGSNTTKR